MPNQIVERIRTNTLFRREPGNLSAWETIGWWESRRVPYNLIVGVAGLITILLAILSSVAAAILCGKPLPLPDPPVAVVIMPIMYAIAANVCYTMGWLVEIVIAMPWKNRWPDFATVTLAVGLLFSVLLTLVPGILFVGLTLVQCVADGGLKWEPPS
jgi:hypothetical protein